MKKKILVFALIVVALFATLSITAFAANSTPSEPTLKIEAANLSFEDSVYVLYAVSHEGIEASNIRMLFWTSPQAEYTVGTEAYAKDVLHESVAVNDKSCAIFKNNELRVHCSATKIQEKCMV